MRAIVAVCRDWGIGKDGDLLVHNKEDMHSFVRHTTGGTVVMGRSTLDSFPGGRPLKNRRNIVLTRQIGFAREGVDVAHSVDEALALVADADPDTVWVIGGASVYRQLLPYCEGAVVTKFDELRDADTFFPDLDADPAFEIAETEEGETCRFVTYRRIGR